MKSKCDHIYLENYGVLMLHSLFEHWPITKQALGIYTKIYSTKLIILTLILESSDGYAERVHLGNLCHLPAHTPIFLRYIIMNKFRKTY